MSPEEFIAKWRGNTRSERAAAQHHFLDLCDLLGVDKPTGSDYDFEKSTRKIGDTQGYADVWKRGHFAWEYKGDRRNLVQAYAQLKQYADALENPPLLIVSDMQEIRVHTNFTNTIAQQHVIPLADLRSVEARELLRNCFLYPERLQPTATRESVTAQAATAFAGIAVRLRQHYDERRVAHFINKLVFCLFAEDIEILPGRVFADVLDEGVKDPDGLEGMMRELFGAMAKGIRFGTTSIPWFNGGLFDDEDVLPLGIAEARALRDAARLDWSVIDPTIFGTLFESGLDDKKRAEMASLFDAPEPDAAQARLFSNPAANRGVGIHYTDEATIMKIIEPVVIAPLRREWEDIKTRIAETDGRRARARSQAEKTRLLTEARGLYTDFRARLGGYRVLDPACGSGNFLALSLRALKDFDHAVLGDAQALGLPPTISASAPRLCWGSRSIPTPPSWPGSPSGSPSCNGSSAKASPSTAAPSSAASTASCAATRSSHHAARSASGRPPTWWLVTLRFLGAEGSATHWAKTTLTNCSRLTLDASRLKRTSSSIGSQRPARRLWRARHTARDWWQPSPFGDPLIAHRFSAAGIRWKYSMLAQMFHGPLLARLFVCRSYVCDSKAADMISRSMGPPFRGSISTSPAARRT